MTATPALELHNISMRFRETPALEDVTLDVLAGEIHALLGENGAGKTTLFKILAGLHPAGTYAGEIRVADRPVSLRTPQDALRQGIGIVPRRSSVFTKMSIAENVTLGRWQQGGHFLMRRSVIEQEAHAILTQLDLKLDPTLPADRLTPGQGRLLMLARALATNPQIVILDEPASYLTTPGEQSQLIRGLRHLAERNIGCLYLARRPAEVALIADRVTVLRDGRLNGSWPRAQLDEMTLTQAMISQRMSAGEDYDRDEAEEPKNILDALRSLFSWTRG